MLVSHLRTHGPWALAVAGLLWVTFHERSQRQRAEEALVVERSLSESRDTMRSAIDRARLDADATRAGIEAVRSVVEAVTRAEQAEAEADIRRAAQDAQNVDDEMVRTGRVTESARRVWREMQR
jgi:hypothetical protein